MKVILAIPGTNPEESESYARSAYPPRGCWSIASYAKAKVPDIEIQILDGSIIKNNQITASVLESGTDLLAVSSHTTLAWKQCLNLINTARQAGISVVVGGVHVSRFPQLVSQYQQVDTITGQGELAFIQYLQYLRGERSKSNVGNLFWWDGIKVHAGPPLPRLRIGELLIPNHTILDIQPYWDSSNKLSGGRRTNRSYVLFTHEGCVWRDKSGGCRFCDLDQSSYFPHPAAVWKEVAQVVSYYGQPIWFKDYGDCFSGSWQYVRDLLKARPAALQPDRDYCLEVYIKSGELLEEWQADLLWQVGVRSVFVGLDHCDNKILKKMRKGASRASHERLVELLCRKPFLVNLGFVLGMEGENVDTLAEVEIFAAEVAARFDRRLESITAGPVCLLPGEPMWTDLRTELAMRGCQPDYFLTDDPDIFRAQLDWLKLKTNINQDPERTLLIIRETAQRILDLAPNKGRFGWKEVTDQERSKL